MTIFFLGMLLCSTLRKLSNIFTLETARYVTEQIVIAFGDNFSNKLKLMFVRVAKFLQVAGTSLQSFLCLARTLGLPEFVEQVSSQNPYLVLPLVPLLFIGPMCTLVRIHT